MNSTRIPSDYKYFLNIVLFFSLCNYDINAIIKSIIKSENNWEKAMFCRLLSITVVEFLEDTLQLFGKDFRLKMSQIFGEKYDYKEINNLKKGMVKFQKVNEDSLRFIRHNTIGHRDHNALKQYEIISTIDPKSFVNLGKGIIRIITKFLKYFTKTINDLKPN